LRYVELIFHSGTRYQEKSTFDSLLANKKLNNLNRLLKKKVLAIPEQASPADIVDRLATSIEANDANFYLDRIKQLISHYKILRNNFSVKDYLDYEAENSIISNAQQVKSRKSFIEYLHGLL